MSSFKRFVTFENLIAKDVIMVIYWFGAAIITLISILIIFTPNYLGLQVLNFSQLYLFQAFGVLILIVGNLKWRIFCEYLIVQFKIYETLKEIKEK